MGDFEVDLHRGVVRLPSKGRSNTAPAGSPFADGGVVVIEGNTGMGKIELAEHMVVFSATQLRMLPVFGSIGPRLNDTERLGIELLKSTVGVFRHMDSSGSFPS